MNKDLIPEISLKHIEIKIEYLIHLVQNHKDNGHKELNVDWILRELKDLK